METTYVFAEPRRECPTCQAHMRETGHPILVWCSVCGTVTPRPNCKEVLSARTREFAKERVGA